MGILTSICRATQVAVQPFPAPNTLPSVQFLLLETWVQRAYGKSTPILHELIPCLADQNCLPYEFTDVYGGANSESVAIDVWFINKNKFKGIYAF